MKKLLIYFLGVSYLVIICVIIAKVYNTQIKKSYIQNTLQKTDPNSNQNTYNPKQMSTKELMSAYRRYMSRVTFPHCTITNENEEVKLHRSKGLSYIYQSSLSSGENRKKYIEQALKEYNMVIYLEPKCWSAHRDIADCYNRLGEKEKAIQIYYKILEGCNDNKQKSRYFRFLVSDLGFRTKKEGESILEKAIEIAPLDTPELAYAYEEMGDFYYQCSELRNEKLAQHYYKKALEVYEKLYENKYPLVITNVLGDVISLESSRILLNKIVELCNDVGDTSKIQQYEQKLKNLLPSDEDIRQELINKIKTILNYKENKNYNPLNISMPGLLHSKDKTNPFEELAHFYMEKKKFEKAIKIYDKLAKDPYLNWTFRTYSVKENEVFNLYADFGNLDRVFQYKRDALQSRIKRYIQTIFTDISVMYQKYLSSSNLEPFKYEKEKVNNDKWYWETEKANIDIKEISDKTGKKHTQFENTICIGWDYTNDTTYRAVIRFCLPNEIKNMEVILAKLCFQSVGNAQTIFSIHKILSPWEENTVNWFKCSSKIKWKNAGGDFIERPLAINMEAYQLKTGTVITFDITQVIKNWISNKEENYGFLIKEYDEENYFQRGITNSYDKEGKMPPRLIIVIKRSTKPDIDGIIEYEEDWVDLYIHGMDGLLDKDLGKTIAYWIEAAKKAEDEQIRTKISEHIKIITDFIREQQTKTKN